MSRRNTYSSQWHPLYQLQAIPNSLRNKQTLFLLCSSSELLTASGGLFPLELDGQPNTREKRPPLAGNSESESLYHLFYFGPFSKRLWSEFEYFWHQLSKEKIQLSFHDFLVGVGTTEGPSNHHLLLYSYFKKRCREKSKKSSRQDRKVMGVVSNPSFAGKQSLH